MINEVQRGGAGSLPVSATTLFVNSLVGKMVVRHTGGEENYWVENKGEDFCLFPNFQVEFCMGFIIVHGPGL